MLPLKKKSNMRPCSKCLENNWAFEFADGMVTATCKYCEAQVQFESKKSKKRKKHPRQYSAKQLAPFNLHDRFVYPGAGPERPAEIMPWN